MKKRKLNAKEKSCMKNEVYRFVENQLNYGFGLCEEIDEDMVAEIDKGNYPLIVSGYGFGEGMSIKDFLEWNCCDGTYTEAELDEHFEWAYEGFDGYVVNPNASKDAHEMHYHGYGATYENMIPMLKKYEEALEEA